MSPDLNLIENLWGLLVRMVYENGRQFNTRQELKTEIINQWEKIPRTYVESLFDSMPRRILEVVEKNGNATHY